MVTRGVNSGSGEGRPRTPPGFRYETSKECVTRCKIVLAKSRTGSYYRRSRGADFSADDQQRPGPPPGPRQGDPWHSASTHPSQALIGESTRHAATQIRLSSSLWAPPARRSSRLPTPRKSVSAACVKTTVCSSQSSPIRTPECGAAPPKTSGAASGVVYGLSGPENLAGISRAALIRSISARSPQPRIPWSGSLDEMFAAPRQCRGGRRY